MAKLIKNSASLRKSLNWFQINKSTNKILVNNISSEEWHSINELYIIGSIDYINNDNNEDFIGAYTQFTEENCYLTHNKDCLIIIGVLDERINDYINLCSNNLKKLSVRFTNVKEIDVSKTPQITSLNLSNNTALFSVPKLNNLSNLKILDISNTLIDIELNLNFFPNIHSLAINNTPITRIVLDIYLNSLFYLEISGTNIDNIDFIKYLKSIRRLNISHTNVKNIPSLIHCTDLEFLNANNTQICSLPLLEKHNSLKVINIGETNITEIADIIIPSNIRNFNIKGNKIRKLPNIFSNLDSLQKINLSNMELDEFPEWLIDLKLEFRFEDKNTNGINLFNTTIKNFDISILSQPRPVIEAWFSSKEGKDLTHELNESKVVFLGDGGAGKSLTIKRILLNGASPSDFNGESTPGISITSKIFNLSTKNILVHFWDFGGQEILHSMHRMFLTKRTLYVVLLNSRDNTQDERAQYWLHNIKSFADGSPVIVVLNQIDQNPSASINEVSLKKLYPQLKNVIKLSAKTYSSTEFNKNFTQTLIDNISQMPSINEPFLPSWTMLKSELQNMKENYIDFNAYNTISNNCGVEDNLDIRKGLLNWFSDLGISFCYSENLELSNFMVLRPDWITNAIYIILFNSSGNVSNGLIKHTTIHQLLNPIKKECIKSVLPNITYTTTEVEYVLGVIRKFKLSYRMDDETEFIPILCDKNEKEIANDFTEGKSDLEFHMHYSYLPNNVLHRLMVELRSLLDIDNVWLSGAVFSQGDNSNTALVKSEESKIKIYVRCSNHLYSPNTYLNIIKNTLLRINESLGLIAEGFIVYKKDDCEEMFNYDYLVESYNHGNKEIYSSVFKKNLKITDILNQSDRDVNEMNNNLLVEVINACRILQSNKKYWEASENERNTYIRDLLRAKGYIISDQTLSGKSSTGKQEGELDLEIFKAPDLPWTIIEALNLKGFSLSDIEYYNNHLIKLIDNYNPSGLQFLFLISYLNCSKEKTKDIWLKHTNHLNEYSPKNFVLQNAKQLNTENSFINGIECTYDCNGLPFTVYHICVRLGE